MGGYLVLEWLDGQSLEEVIETYANKTIEEKVQLFHRVTNALIPLSNWLVHRDLHPSNIMVLDNSFEYKDYLLNHSIQELRLLILEKATHHTLQQSVI